MNTITHWTEILGKILLFELTLVAACAFTLLVGAVIFGAIFLRNKK